MEHSVAQTKQVLGGRDVVKVAACQFPYEFLDKEKCLARTCELIAEAARNGADLIAFPEAWVTTYPFWSCGWEGNMAAWLQATVLFQDNAIVVPGDETERVCDAARRAGTCVVMGINEMDPRPGCRTVYNSLLFVGSDGSLLGTHRKLFPTFIERTFWGAGDGRSLRVFDTDIGRIGGLICGENATLARAALMGKGEEIHIAAYSGCFSIHKGPRLQEPGAEFLGHHLARAHSVEAGAFVVLPSGIMNAKKVPDTFPFRDSMNIAWSNGGSCIVAPGGVYLAAPDFGEQILYAECRAEHIKAMKALIDTLGHYSRPDVFQLTVNEDTRAPAEALARAAAQRASSMHLPDLRMLCERHGVQVEKVEALMGELLSN
ncbi:MAG: carbon-nitrogen hydrolase family protein [Candidatus Binatia bacterium]